MQLAQNKSLPKKEKNFLDEFLFKYLPYWPLFIILIILSGFTAYFILKYTVPQYETTASLLLKDVKKGSEDNEMIASLDQLSTKKIIENEIEILRSKTIMNSVVDKLDLYAPVFETRKLIPQSAYTSSPVAIEVSNPSSLTLTEKVEFKFDAVDSTVILGGKKYALNSYHNTAYGYLKNFPPQGVANTILQQVREELEGYTKLSEQRNTTIARLRELIKEMKDPQLEKIYTDATKEIEAELSFNNLERLASFRRLESDQSLSAEQRLALAISGWRA